jgi:hypothetical protein
MQRLQSIPAALETHVLGHIAVSPASPVGGTAKARKIPAEIQRKRAACLDLQ